jgi:hypothetical protein
MTNLNLANNSLGMPFGWSGPDGDGEYSDPNGKCHKALPAGSSDGVIAIVNAIPDMGALSVLNLAENNLGELVLPEGWTEDYDSDEDEEVYKHTDGREQKDHPGKPEGIIAIANAIPDMRAISSVNLLKNGIGSDQAEALISMLKEHPTLKSLCGIRGD